MHIGGISVGGALLLGLLAIAIVIGVRLIWLHLSGASLSDVSFEWNPVSTASRAARAEQAGHFGEALLLYAQAGQGAQVLERMRNTLPNWPIRGALLSATGELLDLGQRALDPRNGIPQAVRDRLTHYLESAGTVVWTMANHVAAAATLTSAPPAALQGESEKLDQLLQAVRDARSSLADLTLSGSGDQLQSVEQDFRRLSDVAKSLAAEGAHE